MKSKPPIIVAVDPGSQSLGYASVDVHGRVERLGAIAPPPSFPLSRKLWFLEQEIHTILKEREKIGKIHLVLEMAFVAGSGTTTIVLGCVRGVVLAQAARHRARIFEYAHSTVKKSMTGRGNAEKWEVEERVRLMAGISKDEKYPSDAFDALGLALHHQMIKF